MLKSIIETLRERWDTPSTGRRKVFFHRILPGGRSNLINLDNRGEPYCVESAEGCGWMSALSVTLVEDRKQFTLNFDWETLHQLEMPAYQFVCDMMLDHWREANGGLHPSPRIHSGLTHFSLT